MEFPWKNDWLDLQKQYLDALTSAGTKSPWSTPGVNDPLSQLFFPGIGPGGMPPFPGAVTGPGSFFNYGQHGSDLFAQFQSLLKNMSGSETKNTDEWEQLLQEQFEVLKSRLSTDSGQRPIDTWLNGLQESMQAWQALIRPAAPQPGGKSAAGEDGLDAIRSEFLRAAGFTEESKLQADLRDAGKYWEKFTEQSRRFQEILKSVDLAALDTLRDRFLELGKEGASVSSLREIYALWIDSHEKSWSNFLLSDDFSRTYGELINSYLRLNKHFDTMQSRLYEVMQEANSKNRELRNRVEELSKKHEEDRRKIETLQAKVEKLQKKSSAGKTAGKGSGSKRGKSKQKDRKKSTGKKDKNARSKSG